MDEIEKVSDKAKEETLFTELSLGEKLFTYTTPVDGFDLSMVVKRPTLRQKRTAETMYSKEYNKLLQDPDQLTTTQLIEIATKRGTWTSEDELRFTAIDQEIIDTKAELSVIDKDSTTEDTSAAITELTGKLGKLRIEKLVLTSRLGKVVGTSVESFAEKVRTEYLISQCVFTLDDTGTQKLLYNNIEELRNEVNTDKVERISLDAVSFWRGEGLSDFLHLED